MATIRASCPDCGDVEFTSEDAIGDEGYLADRGLIPAPESERSAARKAATSIVPSVASKR